MNEINNWQLSLAQTKPNKNEEESSSLGNTSPRCEDGDGGRSNLGETGQSLCASQQSADNGNEYINGKIVFNNLLSFKKYGFQQETRYPNRPLTFALHGDEECRGA